MIYIEAAHESGMVLATTTNNEVILENLVPNKPEQLWEQGDPDTDGYFNLRNSNVPGVMTAVSSSTLEIRGNLDVKRRFMYQKWPSKSNQLPKLLHRNSEYVFKFLHVGLNPDCVWKDEVCTEIDHGGLTGSDRTLRPLCKQEQTVSTYLFTNVNWCQINVHAGLFGTLEYVL